MDSDSPADVTISNENSISLLTDFLEMQNQHEANSEITKWRFIGYVLELGFDSAKIITSDPYKVAVGGIPRGAFVIMVPENFEGITPHFTLLRINDVATTPLAPQISQTYFELHKKSMPELDIWTQSELQWGALSCDVLGMFYPDLDDDEKLVFSGDVNNILSPHKYKVYSPDDSLLNLIVNSLVRDENKIEIGRLRTMECKLALQKNEIFQIPVKISIKDFMGCRTAMFGKTRLGKSNIVKLIIQGILNVTKENNTVGQLIFDINGEYANDGEQLDITDSNIQKNNLSIRSANENRCIVYTLTKRSKTPSKDLRLNFYEYPDAGISILSSFLSQNGRDSSYIKSFSSVILPSIEDVKNEKNVGEQKRAIRKIQIFWAILHRAGFESDETRLTKLGLATKGTYNFNPGFKEDLREKMNNGAKDVPKTLDELVQELINCSKFMHECPDSPLLMNEQGKSTFDADDKALLEFFAPSSTKAGPTILREFIKYHSPNADDCVSDILDLLDKGMTVILDLGNATDELRKYFADHLSKGVFAHQEMKFVNDKLGNHFVELYFEEAHNLFPINEDVTGVYARFAKEGAKFHIGMVYSTQSPSTINKELLTQTENFFVGHLSSKIETKALSNLQIAFEGIEDDILRSKTPGYMRMLTLSNRFVIPVQAHLYDPKVEEGS